MINIRDLIIRKEFINSLPEEIRLHVLDQRITDNRKAAESADTYSLVHRKSPVPNNRLSPVLPLVGNSHPVGQHPPSHSFGVPKYSYNNSIVCRYCKKYGHVMKNCRRRIQKQRDVREVARTPTRNAHQSVASQSSSQSNREDTNQRCPQENNSLHTSYVQTNINVAHRSLITPENVCYKNWWILIVHY